HLRRPHRLRPAVQEGGAAPEGAGDPRFGVQVRADRHRAAQGVHGGGRPRKGLLQVSWAALLAVGLSAAPVAPPAPPPAPPPQGNPGLAKAEKLLDDLDYDGAAVALLQASKTPRNDRKTILRILELQGLIAASLDQKSSALNFFKQLLALDPNYKLNESTTSAEQRAPFKEAK